VLAYERSPGGCFIEQVYDHQGNLGNGSVPLLVFDAWSMPSTCSTRNVEGGTSSLRLWKIVTWSDVASRYTSAKALSIS